MTASGRSRPSLHLKPNTFALTFVLALMMAMGPISTDLYAPSLPQLARDLDATPAGVQWTMSAYLFGFGIGQLFYGPLSDRYGRKGPLLAGFAIFLAATLVSIFAQNIETLTMARAIQGVGGAGPVIIIRAIVRDLYEGARAGKEMSVMSTIMGIAPIASPLLGGVIALWFGWRGAFVAMFVIVATLITVAALFIPETLKRRETAPMSVREILRSFGIVASNPRWRAYASLHALGHTGLFTFISTSPLMLQKVYGFSAFQFGVAFSICSVAFVIGAGVGSRLVTRIGIDRTIGIGVACYFIAAVTQPSAVYLWPSYPAALVAPHIVFFLGVGFVLPHAIAGALTPFPERAGAASSLQGFMQMFFSAVVGLIVSALLRESAMPLALNTLVMGLGATAVFLSTRHTRAAR